MARLPQLQSFAPQNALMGFREGAKIAEEQQNRNALLAAGDAASRGDYAGAASAAFKGGNLNAGVAFKGLGADEAKQELDTVARLAFAADTPEKWAQFQQAVEAKYPGRAASLGGFDNREAVIAEAQTLDSMISQRFKQQDLTERRADRHERLKMERERLDIARKNAGTTATQKDYNAAVAQGFQGTIFDYQKALNEAKSTVKPPTGYRFTPDGELSPIKGGPKDPDLPTTKQINESAAANAAYKGLDAALTRYEKLVSDSGAELMPGIKRDRLEQERRNIQLQAKELFNLGVLNGPDLELMDQMLFDPTGLQGATAATLSTFGMGDTPTARARESVKGLRQILKSLRDSKSPGQAPTEQPGQTGQAGADGLQTTPSGIKFRVVE